MKGESFGLSLVAPLLNEFYRVALQKGVPFNRRAAGSPRSQV